MAVGAVVFCVVAVFAFCSMSGVGKRNSAPSPAAVPAASTAAPAKPGAAPGGPGVKGPGVPVGAPVAAAPGMPGAGATAVVAAAPGAGPTAVAAGPLLPYRKDPFAVTTRVVKPTRKTVVRAALASLPPYSISTDPIPAVGSAVSEVTAKEVAPEQPFRRMSGVMMDGTVSAVLETRSEMGVESDVVVPGMEINKGHSRVKVERITSSEIILKTLDTKTPLTIRVNMAGSTAITSGQSSTRPVSPIQ